MNTEANGTIRLRAGTGYGYQILMLVLCTYAVAALAFGAIFPLDSETRRILQYADILVCVFFFADFLLNLKNAPNKLRYLVGWGWIDLLSSIPMIDAFRAGCLARVLRIIRALRALRATKILATHWLSHRRQSAAYSLGVASFLLIIFSSVSVLYFEAGSEGPIKSAEDALWWAVTTVTTVGYGDLYPTTMEGRAVAAMLMIVGVGLFGALSGLMAAWLLAPASHQADDEVRELRIAIAELRSTVERLSVERDPTASNTRRTLP